LEGESNIYIANDMSNTLDRVFNEVCLDERITDGIFQMENATHMDALRDYFLKKGVAKEAAITVTNRMVEGKYPERQAYNKDGILVTFPTPQHKARAIARGTHFEKNPVPQVHKPDQEEPNQAPAGSKPEPGELPPDDDEDDHKTDDEDDDDVGGGGGGGSHGGGSKEPTIFQGDKQLEVEPPRGEEPPPMPPQPTVPPAPRTPQRIAAEKEMTTRILSTDDTTISNAANPIHPTNEETRRQLQELFKKADELGYREAITFLSHYVKP
jgi:hypothetical protein